MKKTYFLILGLVIILGAAGWYVYKDLYKEPKPGFGGIVEMPDLDKKIETKDDSLPEVYVQQVISEIENLRAELKVDPDTLQGWIQLGLLHKTLEDYEEVQRIWEFAASIRPKDAIIFHNLGDLYHFYLPDLPRSEQSYLKAIENEPLPFIYQKLYELYRYSYKEKEELADDILLEGIGKNPGDAVLLTTLASYYEETGNTSGAVEYYRKALEIVPDNEELKSRIKNLE